MKSFSSVPTRICARTAWSNRAISSCCAGSVYQVITLLFVYISYSICLQKKGSTHSQKSTSRFPNDVSSSRFCWHGECHSNVKMDLSEPGQVDRSLSWMSISFRRLSGRNSVRPVWVKRLKSPLAHIISKWSLWVSKFDVVCICCKGLRSTRGWKTLAACSGEPKNWGATITACRKWGGAAVIMKCPAETFSWSVIILLMAWQTSLACCGRNTYVRSWREPSGLPMMESG